MVAYSGSVQAGAVFPPIKHSDPWGWTMWFGVRHVPKQGARSTCLGAKNALRSEFLNVLEAAKLEERALPSPPKGNLHD
jgi:hypothetical protein